MSQCRERESELYQIGQLDEYVGRLPISHNYLFTSSQMHESEIVEYINRHKMEETTAKVFARLHQMKTILRKTIKKTPQLCGGISNHNGTYCSPASYYCMNETIDNHHRQSTFTSLTNITSNDTISSISSDSLDSGVSNLSDFSHRSLQSSSSSNSLLHPNRTATQPCHLRCDPSIINYISHNLLTTHRSELFFDDNDDDQNNESPSTQLPLAESSRRIVHDTDEYDQTIVAAAADDEDEQSGPLTSTMVDRWHSVTRAYSATFQQDLSVRKYELVQILRCTHPHWIWIRNEQSNEGFVPTDCFIVS